MTRTTRRGGQRPADHPDRVHPPQKQHVRQQNLRPAAPPALAPARTNLDHTNL